MDIFAKVQTEWHDHYGPGSLALRLIQELADPRRQPPVVTAVDKLRAIEVPRGER